MKPDTPEREQSIRELQRLVKAYDGFNDLITATKNRLHALNPDAEMKNDFILNGGEKSQGLEQIKDKISRTIERELRAWPLYTQWLKVVPGVGPAIAARLILLYYYRFTPVCKCGGTIEKRDGTFWCPDCDKSVKGDGVTKHRIDLRDFPNVSKWHAFMGMAVVDGKAPKHTAGQVANWSKVARNTVYMVWEQFNRQSDKTPYGKLLLDFKRDIERKQPDIKPGHRLNRAKRAAGKIFLAHMWAVARTIDGLPVSDPYPMTILGHTGVIPVYHWQVAGEVAA